ncbi:hypothetical protein [Chondromyces crocatus]|uniref:hypothetical protein n=1 Tax=Chondromyces crocatus TaxID=52 RepID=UPI00067E279B|nr:hypothetical protein [Chondromyces crocatus]
MSTKPLVFFDYRGVVQLRIATPEDLDRIHDLPPARWAATSVPVDQLFCDPALLTYLDRDQDGRIRVQDLLDAHDWLRARLKHQDRISERTDTVHLDDLDPSDADAEHMLQLVRRYIKNGDDDASTSEDEDDDATTDDDARPGQTITLAEIRAFRESYKKKFPNGDGSVAPSQLDDPELAELATLIVKATGGVPDSCGEAGADEATLDTFLQRARALLDWADEARVDPASTSTAIMPFGDDTPRLFEIVDALATKLDQFFAQCDLLTQGSAAEHHLAVTRRALASVDARDPAAIRTWLSGAALAQPNREGVLDLDATINPMFADLARRLATEVLPRALGLADPAHRLDRAEWERVRAQLEPYRAWRARKPEDLPGVPDLAALRTLLDGAAPGNLREHILEDRKASVELLALSDLEKLALLQRWILELANNMVSFPSLFRTGERALFEAGTLVLDGREINLCVRVPDRAAHKKLADKSHIFVVYVELDRKDDGNLKQQVIAAGITSGTRRGIDVHKRGVFYDRDAKEWDARVLDLISEPISVWEAAIAPFVRLRTFVTERVEKLLGSRLEALEKETTEKAGAQVTNAAGAAPLPGGAAPPPAPPPPPAAAPTAAPAAPGAPGLGGGLPAMLVGGGVAFAAIGSSAAFVLQSLSNTGARNVLFTLASVVLGIMSLSAMIGWLKLRRRDVATLLEASGWAFNDRIYLRRKLSHRFTRVPPLPAGSVRRPGFLPDRVADQHGKTYRLLMILGLTLLAALVAAAYHYREPLLAWFGRPGA